ncbi:hypothetical protein V8F33_004064 [Rhypophila sp. PSN 637]
MMCRPSSSRLVPLSTYTTFMCQPSSSRLIPLTTFTCWGQLPTELKHDIFRLLGDDQDITSLVRMNYILVCQTWQHWFEVGNFEHLVINATKTDFNALTQIVSWNPRRQSAVKKLSFRVCLQTQTEASMCGGRRHVRRCLTMTEMFNTLLECLKSWTREPHEKGLVLEINVKSEEESRPIWDALVYQEHIRCCPEVPIVTTLTLRGHYRQCLSYSTVSLLLQRSFPNLERLQIEKVVPTCIIGWESQEEDDLPSDLVQAFPDTLRSWSFINNQSFAIHDESGDLTIPIDKPQQTKHQPLPFEKLRALESIFFFNTIDASRFFLSTSQTTMTWPNLTVLSLNSAAIRYKNSDTRRAILQAAAKAVKHMPQIQRFELWGVHPSADLGACFKYTRSCSYRQAHVLMAVTEPIPPNYDLTAENIWTGEVEKAWGWVAYAHEAELEVDFTNSLGVVNPRDDEKFEAAAKREDFLLVSSVVRHLEYARREETKGWGKPI